MVEAYNKFREYSNNSNNSNNIRIISIRQYLLRNRNRNTSIAYVCDEEKDNLLRLGENLLQTYETDTNLNQNPKTLSKLYSKADMKAQMEKLKKKTAWICKYKVRT